MLRSKHNSVASKTPGQKRTRRSAMAFLCLLLTVFQPAVLRGAQQKKISRIGYVASIPGGLAMDALRGGLRDLGYIEGQDMVIESRSAEGKLDQLPELIADLIRSNVEVIVVSSVQGALAAKKATATIPIVFTIAQDPVGSGVVASLAQPGGNVTGVTDFARELVGKRLELLKETSPKISRVIVLLWKPAGPDYTAEKNEMESTDRALRIELQPMELRATNELSDAFLAAMRVGANGFIGLTDTRFATNRKRIIDLAVEARLPAVYQDRSFVESGGLMSYGTNRSDWRRRIALYVDRILKGAKPSDLPVEQPTKFELVINLKTAKQIGLTIPPNVLARADRVIK
jgi:putative ABC transport system substrate-binding protein